MDLMNVTPNTAFEIFTHSAAHIATQAYVLTHPEDLDREIDYSNTALDPERDRFIIEIAEVFKKYVLSHSSYYDTGTDLIDIPETSFSVAACTMLFMSRVNAHMDKVNAAEGKDMNAHDFLSSVTTYAVMTDTPWDAACDTILKED